MSNERELLENESEAWIIECRTGCTCCANENHYRGPYSSDEKAKEEVERFKAMPLLASQYSSTGVYSIEKVIMERISNGRYIIGDTVFNEDDNAMDAGNQMWGLWGR